MNNSAAILRLRALIIFAFCIPLAMVVGFTVMSLANGPTYANSGEFGLLALILSSPILLRRHHPLLVLSWNLPLVIFFVNGAPPGMSGHGVCDLRHLSPRSECCRACGRAAGAHPGAAAVATVLS